MLKTFFQNKEINYSPKTLTILARLVLVLLVGAGFWLGKDYLKTVETFPASSKTPTPTESSGGQVADSSNRTPYTLPSGSQTYRFSHGEDVVGPKIQTVTIDPLDPQNNATQTISLEIESESSVQSAVIIVSTDNREKTLNLKLISGDSQKGTYQGSWQVDDTYENKYSFRYILTSETDTFDNTMYLR